MKIKKTYFTFVCLCMTIQESGDRRVHGKAKKVEHLNQQKSQIRSMSSYFPSLSFFDIYLFVNVVICLLMSGVVFWKVHYLFCIFNRIHTEVFISEGPVKSVNESMKADIRIMAHCVLFVTGAPIKGLSTEKYWGETWFLSWLHSLWVLD